MDKKPMLGKAALRWSMCFAVTALLFAPPTVMSEGGTCARSWVPSVSGNITDTNGVPIFDVTVRLVLSDRSDYDHAFTDKSGAYSLNITFFGIAFLEFEKYGFLKYRSDPFLLGGSNVTFDTQLEDLPPQTEHITGTVTFTDGGVAQDVLVKLDYSQENNYFDYSQYTDDKGIFDIVVFPGSYDVQMDYKGFRVVEETLLVTLGGMYYLDRVIVRVPDTNATLRGFVNDGKNPLEGVFIVIADQGRELQTYAASNETGYFSAAFWGGEHIILAMYEGHDTYYSWIEVPAKGSKWVNMTIQPRDVVFSGTVLDGSGDPVAGMTVSLNRPHIMPDSYTDLTDESGSFEIEISKGGGYLVVSGEDAFEGGDHELYLEKLDPIDSDIVVGVRLSDVTDQAQVSSIIFDGWEKFDVSGKLNMSVNRTRYLRLFIDSYIGNADQYLSQSEFDEFYELMMADSEMESAPFGHNTSGNITIDGLYYDRETYSIEFRSIAGSADDMNPAYISIEAKYALNGSLPARTGHELMFNFTYDQPGSETIGTIGIPQGWMVYNYTADNVTIVLDGNEIGVRPGKDLDKTDETTFEKMYLNVFTDELSTRVNFPQAYEGESSRFSVAVEDSLPENVYNITWDMGDSAILYSSKRSVNHSYDDDGTYKINLTLKDSFGRTSSASGEVIVLNKAPTVSVVANRTKIGEGDLALVSVFAEDVPSDDLFISWFVNGSFLTPVPLTEASATRSVSSKFEGNRTVSVRVSDEDGGLTEKGITISIHNKDPVLSAKLVTPRPNNITYENETVMVEIVSLFDSDELTIDIKVSRSDCRRDGMNITPKGTGKYEITLTVTDPQGGEASEKWIIQVLLNVSLDHDGDGIPMIWEKDHGLDDYLRSDGNSDSDKDGLTNFEEYVKGSDPFDKYDPYERKEDNGWIVLAVLALIVLAVIIAVVLVIQNRMKESIEE